MPRIEERYTDLIDGFEAEGKPAVVVEYSVFRNRQSSLAYGADVVMAVLAPLETRIERAVKSGFSEEDVRARIARSPTPTASRPRMSSSTTTAPPTSCATKSSPGGTSTRRRSSGMYSQVLAKALRALVLGALLWLHEGSDEFSGALILGLRN